MSADNEYEQPLGDPANFVEEETPARTGGRSETILLAILGLLMVGGGVAFHLAPQYSPALDSVGNTLEAAGFQSGTMLLAGLVFFALALYGRAIGRSGNVTVTPIAVSAASTASSGPDTGLLIEQVMADVAALKTTVLQVSEEITSVVEGQQRLLQVQTRTDNEMTHNEQHNALFRLAASLDQMNARMDERFNALAVHVQEQVGAMGASAGPAYAGARELEVLVNLENDPNAREPQGEYFDDLGQLDAILPDDKD